MLPPLSNGLQLDENWGIVVIFWQFNDLVGNDWNIKTPTSSWWEKVRELILELKFLKVGVVCGATARTWQLGSEYDNIVSSVRRMLTLEGIPWFDGTNLYSTTERKGWHILPGHRGSKGAQTKAGGPQANPKKKVLNPNP
jgi:hypothetical protein